MSASTAARPARTLLARLSATVAAALALGAAAATLATAPAAAAATGNWVMTGWNIHQLNQLSPAVASHAIAPAYTWVMYDLEYWAQTPLAEQQNPAAYMQQFGQLAHAHGLKVIEAPGRDLALVPGTACPPARGDNLDHWYLRCDIPGAAAADADLLVVQDQVNTTNPAEFDYLYTTARTQAQAANPAITTDAEVSTTYGTATQMATAAKSANADGIYINATTNTLGKASSFLRIMQNA